MLRKLANLSKTSSLLRARLFEKEAGLATSVAKGIGKATLGAGKWAVKNPGAALGVGLTAAQAVPTAVGKFHQSKREFDPAYQSQKINTMASP